MHCCNSLHYETRTYGTCREVVSKALAPDTCTLHDPTPNNMAVLPVTEQTAALADPKLTYWRGLVKYSATILVVLLTDMVTTADVYTLTTRLADAFAVTALGGIFNHTLG